MSRKSPGKSKRPAKPARPTKSASEPTGEVVGKKPAASKGKQPAEAAAPAGTSHPASKTGKPSKTAKISNPKADQGHDEEREGPSLASKTKSDKAGRSDKAKPDKAKPDKAKPDKTAKESRGTKPSGKPKASLEEHSAGSEVMANDMPQGALAATIEHDTDANVAGDSDAAPKKGAASRKGKARAPEPDVSAAPDDSGSSSDAPAPAAQPAAVTPARAKKRGRKSAASTVEAEAAATWAHEPATDTANDDQDAALDVQEAASRSQRAKPGKQRRRTRVAASEEPETSEESERGDLVASAVTAEGVDGDAVSSEEEAATVDEDSALAEPDEIAAEALAQLQDEAELAWERATSEPGAEAGSYASAAARATRAAEGAGEAGEQDELIELEPSLGGEPVAAAEGEPSAEGPLGEDVDDEGLAATLPTSANQLTDLQLEGLLEALIFASDKPLTLQRLRQLTRVSDSARLTRVLDSMTARYQGRGIAVSAVSGGYQFRTESAYSAWVQQLIAGRPVRLSRAQLETLAIIAYRQPITRPEIDEIRGVDSTGTLKVLMDRNLVRILGKREEVGRPMLYGTTKEFLDFFSLGDLRELPTLREYSELSPESRAIVAKMGFDDGEGDGGEAGAAGSSGDGNEPVVAPAATDEAAPVYPPSAPGDEEHYISTRWSDGEDEPTADDEAGAEASDEDSQPGLDVDLALDGGGAPEAARARSAAASDELGEEDGERDLREDDHWSASPDDTRAEDRGAPGDGPGAEHDDALDDADTGRMGVLGDGESRQQADDLELAADDVLDDADTGRVGVIDELAHPGADAAAEVFAGSDSADDDGAAREPQTERILVIDGQADGQAEGDDAADAGRDGGGADGPDAGQDGAEADVVKATDGDDEDALDDDAAPAGDVQSPTEGALDAEGAEDAAFAARAKELAEELLTAERTVADHDDARTDGDLDGGAAIEPTEGPEPTESAMEPTQLRDEQDAAESWHDEPTAEPEPAPSPIYAYDVSDPSLATVASDAGDETVGERGDDDEGFGHAFDTAYHDEDGVAETARTTDGGEPADSEPDVVDTPGAVDGMVDDEGYDVLASARDERGDDE